jgi:trehalose 6-phosphate phosphatase
MQTTAAARQADIGDSLPVPGDLRSVALLLDIDGTIIDVAPTPADVEVPHCLRGTLADLHTKTGGALALVSGRLISDADRLFAPLRLPAIGGHGAEMRFGGDRTVPRSANIDAALRHSVATLMRDDPRIIVEDKGYSLAVHYRLAPEREHGVKADVAALLARAGYSDLEMLEGKAVVEIKQPALTKGLAVCELMNHAPFIGRRPIFVGDDYTDETVFAILPAFGGVGYSVERPIAGASGIFESPREVRRWLAAIAGRGGHDGHQAP